MDDDRINNDTSNEAIIVVDIVHDFVDGKFGSERALKTASDIIEFLKRVKRREVILTADTHVRDDPEFSIWGEHCIEGTWGSQLLDALIEFGTRIIRKRHYDAFFDSDLDGYLRTRNIQSLIIFGISTDICVRHTVAGAFFRNYHTSLIEDLCSSIDPERHEEAVSEIRRLYGTRILKKEDVK